jgi:hypothetical protein
MQSIISDTELGFHEGIDKGDETALGAFSDWLEEHDDPRAEGYRFLRDKKRIPTLPDMPRTPWKHGLVRKQGELVVKISKIKRLAFKVACVVAAVHDAVQAIPVFESASPNDHVLRRTVAAARQWIEASKLADTTAGESAPELSIEAVAAHAAAQEAQVAATRVAAAVIAREAAIASTMAAYAAAGSVMTVARDAVSAASAANGALRELSLFPDAAASARWCWIDCVYQHIVLIPKELADKFARAVPPHSTTTRRQITDAFAMSFVEVQPDKER